jgi:hypothetical protein
MNKIFGAHFAAAIALCTIVAVTSGSATASGGPVVITATLKSASGPAVASRPVELLWDGGTGAPVKSLARGETDANGLVTISYTPTAADLAAAKPNGDWFNFTVFVGSGDSAGVVSVPRKWTGDSWTSEETDTPAGVAALAASRQAAPAPTPLTVSLTDMRQSKSSAAKFTAQPATVTDSWTRYTAVANIPSGTDMQTNFTYGSKGNSEVGMFSNSGGGWAEAGTTHVSNTEAAVHGSVVSKASKQAKVSMLYKQYSECVNGQYCWTERKAVAWTGGLKLYGITNYSCKHGAYHKTFKYPDVKGASKTQGTNRTYDVGATIGSLGFSAKSGYGTTVKMNFDFRIAGGTSNTHFCLGGSNHNWPTASTLYASSSK